MRSIGDPNYIYSPWSEGRRRAAAMRARHMVMRAKSDLMGPLLPEGTLKSSIDRRYDRLRAKVVQAHGLQPSYSAPAEASSKEPPPSVVETAIEDISFGEWPPQSKERRQILRTVFKEELEILDNELRSQSKFRLYKLFKRKLKELGDD